MQQKYGTNGVSISECRKQVWIKPGLGWRREKCQDKLDNMTYCITQSWCAFGEVHKEAGRVALLEFRLCIESWNDLYHCFVWVLLTLPGPNGNNHVLLSWLFINLQIEMGVDNLSISQMEVHRHITVNHIKSNIFNKTLLVFIFRFNCAIKNNNNKFKSGVSVNSN